MVMRHGIPLPAGRIPGVWVEDPAELRDALAGLGLAQARPVLVLVGGASNLDPSVAETLLRLFEHLAPRLDRAGAAVVDGATAYGVMALMGLARHRTGARFPLLGVAAIGTVDVPTLGVGGPKGTATLDPHHSHVILVPGTCWGDESPWISASAAVLAGPRPSLTLVAAGGEVTRLDVAQSLGAGRPLLVIAGSGGTADQLARWRRGGAPPAGMSLDTMDLGLMQVLDLEDPAAVGDLVSATLGV
jgi:hypothetical protein